MDVTFCENEPYLSQDSLQGENNVEQLLNQPSHPLEQPEHLLNQPVFETDKPEQPNPIKPRVSTTKIDSRPRGGSLQQPELRVYSRSNPRIVETKMNQQCCQESEPIVIPKRSFPDFQEKKFQNIFMRLYKILDGEKL
ncbi:hypothetical protein CK203_035937 [Vitis vinifera]|uniref:Uncharacterized protein n=1 Tax=Vitis vinifera TaxID=29760 RepID=A0A438I0C9_VITVI|nr:hypothetical protein CK203_035937 [Vitis vinifera]